MANSKSYKQEAYKILKHKILSNEFKPNQYLEEKKLCELLEISRTPIREAINLLAQEHLVQIIPNKGVFVSELSFQFVNDIFEARILIEPFIFEKAFDYLEHENLLIFQEQIQSCLKGKNYPSLQQLDYDLHNYINSCCRNDYLIQIINNISDHFQRIRTEKYTSSARTEHSAMEHLQLIEFILQGRKDESLELLKKHIQKYYMQNL